MAAKSNEGALNMIRTVVLVGTAVLMHNLYALMILPDILAV
jgi:hypothetical protein